MNMFSGFVAVLTIILSVHLVVFLLASPELLHIYKSEALSSQSHRVMDLPRENVHLFLPDTV